jgi:protein-arginine kinase activator protein McsA
MDAVPVCIACEQKRHLLCVIPIINRHEMRVFECERCKSKFRLVAERQPNVPKDDFAFA